MYILFDRGNYFKPAVRVFFTMTRYQKGSSAERELIGILYSKGYSVVRAAGSGKSSLPSPDLVALSQNKKFAFECKAWDSDYLSISIGQMEEQLGWCERAGIDFVVAWKMPRQGFVFLTLNDFAKTEKNYVVSKESALKKGSTLEILLGFQARLKV